MSRIVYIDGFCFFKSLVSGVERHTPVRHITGVVYDDSSNTTTVKFIDGDNVSIHTTTDKLYYIIINAIASNSA